jgi:hypothetical protein
MKFHDLSKNLLQLTVWFVCFVSHTLDPDCQRLLAKQSKVRKHKLNASLPSTLGHAFLDYALLVVL